MEAWYVHIEGALKGRLDAQRGLYEALAPRVLYTCRRYFTQEAEAEDAMIRTMTTMFQQLPTIREAKALPAWLRRTAVNECLMELRRRKVEWVGADALPDSGSSATDSLHDREALMELLRQLPDGYRAVFNLYALEGYSHAEIAEQLGISEATSKSQLSRARQWLQRRLGNFDLQ